MHFAPICTILLERTCRCDGIGRRSGLKIHRWRHRAGSSPATGTNKKREAEASLFLFMEIGDGLEPIQMQQSGGLLLPPVQTLVATVIFANGENANRVRPTPLFFIW